MNIIEKQQLSDSLMENILKNNGIEDIDTFLQPNNNDDTDIYNFKHMEDMAKNMLFHLSKGSNILVVVDPDQDGYASSAILIQFVNDVIDNYELQGSIDYIMQDGKEHGLSEDMIDKINKIEPDLIILPDAATNDTFELLTLSTMEYDIFVIDHHEIEDETQLDLIPRVTIVNNQRSDNGKVNKEFTGAGMVYNFIKMVYTFLETPEEKIKHPDYYLDLVAIGQIGDVSDIANNEIRNIVFTGLNNINNPFISSVLKLKSVNTKKVAPLDLSFSIIPMVNATTRVGSMDDKNKLFNAMIMTEENNHDTPIMKRKLNKETRKYEQVEFIMSFTDAWAEDIVKVKNKQDSVVKKTMTELDKQTDHGQGILIYTMEKLEFGSITGLVAMKLSKKYSKPCLVLLDNGDYLSGSGRGIEKVMDSFKDWCENSELFEFARGHANAFGVSIHKDKFDKLLDTSSKFDSTPSDDYEVDKKYTRSIVSEDVDLVIKFKHVIGGKVQSPLFGFEDITIPKKYIYTKGKTIEFYVGGVAFVSWQSPEELIEKLTSGFKENYKVNLVGEPFEVNFSGSPKNKIVIKDIEVIEDSDEETDFFF